MKLGKDWEITSDPLNVTLSKRSRVKATDKKPAHDSWAVKGYYSSIENALKGLVGFGLKETELKDLSTIQAKIDELNKLIENKKGG